MSLKTDWLSNNSISEAARDSGEISSSIPNLVKPTSSLWLINSGLEILAMVRLAPNCFAKTQEVMLEVSEEVTEINTDN